MCRKCKTEEGAKYKIIKREQGDAGKKQIKIMTWTTLTRRAKRGRGKSNGRPRVREERY